MSYSQRDLERNVRRKFTRTVVASVAEKSIPLVLNGPSVDTGDAIAQLTSPSGALSVTLRSIAGEKKKHFVEVSTKKTSGEAEIFRVHAKNTKKMRRDGKNMTISLTIGNA